MARPRTYVTRQGDTWDQIAYRLWGRETMMDTLMRANPEHGDVLVFDPDVTLAVPEAAAKPAVPDLPPWMLPDMTEDES